MDIAETTALERIARVIAATRLSINADGRERSAGGEVDEVWRSYLDDARAVLNTLREPDQRMVAVGDLATWSRMVSAALGEDVSAEPRSWQASSEIYQKPLG